jgi:hypothetical protein
MKGISSFTLGSLALLTSAWGCATAVTPVDSAYRQSAATGPQSVSSPPPPSARPRAHSPPPPPQPAKPAPLMRPPASAAPGISARPFVGTATRLLSIPAAIAAVLLWPSSLDDSSRNRGWTGTLNPVTLMPWASGEEYDQFWQLPQQERERLIRESRSTMAHSPPSTPTPQPAPQETERRHPDQTCDNAVLDHLQAEKSRICSSIPGESCSPKKVNPKRLDNEPCSAVRRRIQAFQNCLNIRQFIQDECFSGLPDEPHARVMSELKSGLAHCLALEARNCAPGHPMSER